MDNTTRRPSLPKIGMRNIKTAVAAALCALVYLFFPTRSPAFACIGAIFGMGGNLEQSKLHGGNRFFGTIIGGFIGMLMFRIHLIFYPEGGITWMLVPLVFLGTVLLILCCQKLWVGGIQPGGVVLCIVLFNTPVDSYISYSLNRIFDTGVGVLVALLVNSLFPGGFTFTWMAKIYADYIETAGERYAKDQADRQIRIMHRNQNQGKKGPWI